MFYLRMLLVDGTYNHSAGKKSFQDLRTVNGVEYDTFKETCRALGLLEDDHLRDLVMEDAKQQKLPRQMRDLFIILLSEANMSDPKVLFEKYHESMSEDFEYQLLPPNSTDKRLWKDMVLISIQKRLQGLEKSVIQGNLTC